MASTKTPSSFSPAREELLRDIHADAQILSNALSTLFDLLQCCDSGHQVTTGGMLALLEPFVGGLDTLVGDLQSACNVGALQ